MPLSDMLEAPPAATRRRPPEVQQLLDGLMYLHAQVEGPGKRNQDQVGAEAKLRMKAWFGSLPVERRVELLQLHEPAFVKLLMLLANKARDLPPRKGRRPSTVKFFVFAESVPALAASFSGPGKGRPLLRYVFDSACVCIYDAYGSKVVSKRRHTFENTYIL